MKQSEVFARDLERHNSALKSCGAVIETGDSFAIDPERAPDALISSYRRLLSYGYANGYL